MGIELSLGGWCLQEFCSIKLGDDRLNKRLCKVAETLLNNPTAAIQDTTTLDYTHHRHKKKMKPIKHDKCYKKPLIGCLLHNTLLVSEKGLPVGLLDQKIFQHESLKDEHKNRPISKKKVAVG